MKQRIVIQAIVHNQDGNVLVMRRSTGRPNSIGQYELPGGTLDPNEQIEDALGRHLKNNLGISLEGLKLKDAISMDNLDSADVQHVFIIYETTINDYIDIKPQGSYDAFMWANNDTLESIDLRDSAATILNIIPKKLYQDRVMTLDKSGVKQVRYLLYSDGGSRGNPGPSAAGYVLFDRLHQQVVGEGGSYLGLTTNNQAEYHGLRIGLENAIQKGIRSIDCKLDSTLVVNQLNGVYNIKNRDLWPVYERILSYISMFEHISFSHIPREENRHADAIVNRILDEHSLEN